MMVVRTSGLGRWLVGGLVAVAWMLVTLVPAATAQEDPWHIGDYDVEIVVGSDSVLEVTETISVVFEGDQRGIFRFWEVTESLPNPLPPESTIQIEGDPSDYQRITDIRDISVTSPTGAPTALKLTEAEGELTARIGDPDTFVTGDQTYVINYTVAGAMNSFPDHAELYWDPVGSWGVPIEDLTVTVESEGIQQVACFAGVAGSSDQTCPATFDQSTATFDFGRVEAGRVPTIVVGIDDEVVEVASPIIEKIPGPGDVVQDLVFGNLLAVGAAILVLVGGLGLVFLRVWRDGRDRVAVGGVTAAGQVGSDAEGRRRGVFEKPLVPTQFRPPDDLQPGLLGVIVDERVDPVDVSATIVDLAAKGHITITEIESSGWFSNQDWLLSRVPGTDATSLSHWELELMGGLFEDRTEVELSSLKGKFAPTYQSVTTQLYDAVTANGWFRSDPDSTRNKWRATGLVLVVLGFISAFFLAARGWLLLSLAIGIVGIAVLALSGRAPARTAKGSKLLTETLGFREFIVKAEADRMDFAEKELIFASYLPYAVVFGVVDRWAQAFADIGVDITSAVGHYYVGYGPLNAYALSRGLNSFSGVASTAVATAPPSSSGGGSGFSGGGFSGGGGGGGGGGAW